MNGRYLQTMSVNYQLVIEHHLFSAEGVRSNEVDSGYSRSQSLKDRVL